MARRRGSVRCRRCGSRICSADLPFEERMEKVRRHYKRNHADTLF